VNQVDPLVYRARWRVRSYEIDQNGHVNNAVYLNYAEALTVEHAEARGLDVESVVVPGDHHHVGLCGARGAVGLDATGEAHAAAERLALAKGDFINEAGGKVVPDVPGSARILGCEIRGVRRT